MAISFSSTELCVAGRDQERMPGSMRRRYSHEYERPVHTRWVQFTLAMRVPVRTVASGSRSLSEKRVNAETTIETMHDSSAIVIDSDVFDDRVDIIPRYSHDIPVTRTLNTVAETIATAHYCVVRGSLPT